MTEFPEHLADFNLETYEDMQNNTEIDVAGTDAIIFEDINAMILTKGKRGENQKNCLSKMLENAGPNPGRCYQKYSKEMRGILISTY